MLLDKLLKNCKTKGGYDGKTEILSVCCDSRKADAGALFIALRGQNTDGAFYAKEAAQRGAVYMVCEEEPRDASLPWVKVPDCRSACAVIFSNFYKNPDKDMHTVAVTGTNGKTTTCAVLSHIFSCDGRRTGLVGTVSKGICDGTETDLSDNNMTTPNPDELYRYLYLMKEKKCDTAVLEASSHALEYSKFDGMHVDVGVMTNLTPEHLDFHGTMESYYRAKKRLAEMSRVFVVNRDDPYGERLCREFPDALAFSAVPESAADKRVFATAAMYRSRGFSGIEYMFCAGKYVFPLKSKMTGKNALYNTAAAAAAALASGVSPCVIQRAVSSFEGVKGRYETVAFGSGVPRVIIDYAHTPDSFEKVLVDTRFLMNRGARLILVFGCGGERDASKRSVMGTLAKKYADVIVVTNDNPRGEDPLRIIDQILEGLSGAERYYVMEDRQNAIEFAVNESTPRDVVLVLGKGHEEYIIDKNGKKYFSEKEIIRRAVFDKFGVL